MMTGTSLTARRLQQTSDTVIHGQPNHQGKHMDIHQKTITFGDGRVLRVFQLQPHEETKAQGDNLRVLSNIEEKLDKAESAPTKIKKNVTVETASASPSDGDTAAEAEEAKVETEAPVVIHAENKTERDGSRVEAMTKRIKLPERNPPEETPSTKSPPQSAFAKLGPSKNRYTILSKKDEL
jgi:hypothetical protein